MATTSGAARQSIVAARNVQTRRRSTVSVGVGEDVFWVPSQAIAATEYPLLGIKHAVMQIPNDRALPQLRIWVALEQRLSGDDWDTVWLRCLKQKPRFFQRCLVVCLAQRSRALPAGNVLFRSTNDLITIPTNELGYLPRPDQQRIQRAYANAIMNLPSQRLLHFLQPLYTTDHGTVRLATIQDATQLIQKRRDAVLTFCQKHGQKVLLHESEEHFRAAHAKHQIQLIAARLKLARARAEWGNTQLSWFEAEHARRELAFLAKREEALITEWASRCGLSIKPTGLAERAFALGITLKVIDPILAFEEPAWRLSIYDDEVIPLRLVAHWDDQGVTLLR